MHVFYVASKALSLSFQSIVIQKLVIATGMATCCFTSPLINLNHSVVLEITLSLGYWCSKMQQWRDKGSCLCQHKMKGLPKGLTLTKIYTILNFYFLIVIPSAMQHTKFLTYSDKSHLLEHMDLPSLIFNLI